MKPKQKTCFDHVKPAVHKSTPVQSVSPVNKARRLTQFCKLSLDLDSGFKILPSAFSFLRISQRVKNQTIQSKTTTISRCSFLCPLPDESKLSIKKCFSLEMFQLFVWTTDLNQPAIYFIKYPYLCINNNI